MLTVCNRQRFNSLEKYVSGRQRELPFCVVFAGPLRWGPNIVPANKQVAEDKTSKDEKPNEKAPVASGNPASPAAQSGAPVKKALGAKEVIPLAWKLVGVTPDAAVTLFKAIEKEDVEAQYARLIKDPYYKDLRILPVDAKVTQPKAAKAAKTGPKSKPSEVNSSDSKAGAKRKKSAASKKTVVSESKLIKIKSTAKPEKKTKKVKAAKASKKTAKATKKKTPAKKKVVAKKKAPAKKKTAAKKKAPVKKVAKKSVKKTAKKKAVVKKKKKK